MTRAEKIKLIREKYPNYQDIFSQGELEGLIADLDDPQKVESFRTTGATEILGGAAIGGGIVKGAQAIKGAAKAITARKAAKEAAGTAIKKGGKVKKAAKLGIAGAAVATGINIIESLFGGDAEQEAMQEQALQDQANLQTQLTFAQMEASGVDVQGLLATQAGQQILKNPNFNVQTIFGANSLQLGGTGVYVGGEVDVRRRKPTARETGVITMQDWKQQFPIANPNELAQWKKRLVDAGVVGADAGVVELRQQWEAWGKLSMDSMRTGQKLTPYQLLDIQRGLWGGGGGGPSYQVQLMKKENSMAIFKQGLQALTGRIVDDTEAEDFAELVRKRQLKRPTKTETKMVGGKKVTVTTPGFGEAEAASLVEKRAQKDPLYAEFQTANVFGSALEKALGVRG